MSVLALTLHREVAHTLQVSPNMVRTWLEEGTLDAFLSPYATPWIQCLPTRARRLRILKQGKKRHSAPLQADQSGRRKSKEK